MSNRSIFETLLATWQPLQAEGGDNHGSPAFFRGLAEICKNHDISLMMDEVLHHYILFLIILIILILLITQVQTGGGATGKMWCHEHFGIEADVVSFSKKMVSGGVFHNMEHRSYLAVVFKIEIISNYHRYLFAGPHTPAES